MGEASGLLFVAVNYLAYKELAESGRSSRDLEAFRRRCFYSLFIFQFILHIKMGPLRLWPFVAVKPLKCFVANKSNF